jgi:hypothetical protein
MELILAILLALRVAGMTQQQSHQSLFQLGLALQHSHQEVLNYTELRNRWQQDKHPLRGVR